MRHLPLTVLLTMLSCSWLALTVPGAESSGGYRGPQRNGIYPATGLLKTWPAEGPKLLWQYRDLGPGWASATVAGDTVYCLGGAPEGSLFAFALDGTLRWKKPYGPEFTSRFDGTRSTPTVTDGRVIFSSGKKDERSIYCLDAETGEKLWHVDGNAAFGGQAQGWGYNESPLVVDDLVVFTLRAKDDVTPPLVALDIETGKKVWGADPGAGDYSAGDSSLSIVGPGKDRLIVANLWRAIIAVEPETGKTVWTIPISQGTVITPTYNDGYLLLGKGGYDSVTMLKMSEDHRSYDELWSTEPKTVNGISQAVILDAKVFMIGNIREQYTDDRGRERSRKALAWMCFDVETGAVLKTQPCMCDGSIVAAEGLVYIMEGGERHWKDPKISLLKPTADGFELVSSFSPVVGTKELWVSPTIAAGRLFVRHGSVLSVYDIRDPASSG